MIKITNGVLTTEVTQGAFELFYADQGFRVVHDNDTKNKLDWEENENEEN